MHKLKYLLKKNGFFLTLLRLPYRVFKTILNRLNTFFWSFFLQEMGRNCLIEFGVKIENPKQLILKNNVYIGENTIFGSEYNDGICILHDHVHINKNCRIDHTGHVELQKHVLLSDEVVIFSHSHGYNPYSKAIPKNLYIGERSWIGYRSILLESVEIIEQNCIISAGAIVTKSCIDENSVYGGVPAKKIKAIVRDE